MSAPENIAIPASPVALDAPSPISHVSASSVDLAEMRTGNDAHAPPSPIRTPTPKAVNLDSAEEPEEGELRQFGSLYVEDIRHRFYRQIHFQDQSGENQLEVYIYKLGYVDMVSIGGTSVPLNDLLNVQHIGYWDKEYITMYLKNDHKGYHTSSHEQTVFIPKIPNTMLIESLSYISNYPYEIPGAEEEEQKGDDSGSDVLLFGVFLLFIVAVLLWFYYLVVGHRLVADSHRIEL